MSFDIMKHTHTLDSMKFANLPNSKKRGTCIAIDMIKHKLHVLVPLKLNQRFYSSIKGKNGK